MKKPREFWITEHHGVWYDQPTAGNYIKVREVLHDSDLETLRSQLAICKEALEFYACRSHEVSVWKDMPQEDWGVKPEEVDNGEIARQALSQLEVKK
jgi:hypothetical protein